MELGVWVSSKIEKKKKKKGSPKESAVNLDYY